MLTYTRTDDTGPRTYCCANFARTRAFLLALVQDGVQITIH